MGELAGLSIRAGLDTRFGEEWVAVPDACIELCYPVEELQDIEASALVQRLERRVQGLDAALGEARGERQSADQEAQRARARIGSPFRHEAELQSIRRRQLEINEQLAATSEIAFSEPSPPQGISVQAMPALDSGDSKRARALGRR